MTEALLAPEPSEVRPAEPGTSSAIARFLAQFPTRSRAEALHLALKALRARLEPDRVLACELAWEVHQRGYWSQLKGDDGAPYETEEEYFRDVLAVASWRTAYRRLAVGRMLSAFDEPERSAVRAAIAEVGLAKAATLVPAIERTGTWQIWLDLARQLSAPILQERVSAALQAAPRGRELAPPGDRFRRAVLSAMPDIEAMELVERFFEIGATMAGTPHPVAIFLAGCRECLAEWEPHVARRPIAPGHRQDASDRSGEGCEEVDEGGHGPSAVVCQQWQTKAGP